VVVSAIWLSATGVGSGVSGATLERCGGAGVRCCAAHTRRGRVEGGERFRIKARSSSSPPQVPIYRSMMAFICGTWTPDLTTRMSAAVNTS
jgi:hypothetical protein